MSSCNTSSKEMKCCTSVFFLSNFQQLFNAACAVVSTWSWDCAQASDCLCGWHILVFGIMYPWQYLTWVWCISYHIWKLKLLSLAFNVDLAGKCTLWMERCIFTFEVQDCLMMVQSHGRQKIANKHAVGKWVLSAARHYLHTKFYSTVQFFMSLLLLIPNIAYTELKSTHIIKSWRQRHTLHLLSPSSLLFFFSPLHLSSSPLLLLREGQKIPFQGRHCSVEHNQMPNTQLASCSHNPVL